MPTVGDGECTVAHWGTSAGTVAADGQGESIANDGDGGHRRGQPSVTVGVCSTPAGSAIMQNAGTTNWVVSNADTVQLRLGNITVTRRGHRRAPAR